jgi:hypothetical protein
VPKNRLKFLALKFITRVLQEIWGNIIFLCIFQLCSSVSGNLFIGERKEADIFSQNSHTQHKTRQKRQNISAD